MIGKQLTKLIGNQLTNAVLLVICNESSGHMTKEIR
jgi:hypothetical protein